MLLPSVPTFSFFSVLFTSRQFSKKLPSGENWPFGCPIEFCLKWLTVAKRSFAANHLKFRFLRNASLRDLSVASLCHFQRNLFGQLIGLFPGKVKRENFNFSAFENCSRPFSAHDWEEILFRDNSYCRFLYRALETGKLSSLFPNDFNPLSVILIQVPFRPV